MLAFEKKEIIRENKDIVFGFISNPNNLVKYGKDVVKVEIFGSKDNISIGTKINETRLFGKKEISAVIEVSHYLLNDEIAFQSKSVGMSITYFYSLKAIGSGTELSLKCFIKSNIIMKIFVPAMRKMLLKQDGDHLTRIKEVIEGYERK
ncbi:hypothetical protein ACFSCX_00495 [Bacillus salitolerans]|uniref:SRPBCC family protein n=1 Tax=Bacillus salitolerans TaxID=1437434 RepID=A0ABW4LIV4_9BACI